MTGLHDETVRIAEYRIENDQWGSDTSEELDRQLIHEEGDLD